jgi:hypothetical protein
LGKLKEKLFETISLDRELKISPPDIGNIISQNNISIIRNQKVNKYRLSLIGDLDFKNLLFPISDKICSLGADLSIVKGHPDEEGGYRQNYFFRFDDIDYEESDRLLSDAFDVDVIRK